MKRHALRPGLNTLTLSLLSSLTLLTACGGGGKDAPAPAPALPSKGTEQPKVPDPTVASVTAADEPYIVAPSGEEYDTSLVFDAPAPIYRLNILDGQTQIALKTYVFSQPLDKQWITADKILRITEEVAAPSTPASSAASAATPASSASAPTTPTKPPLSYEVNKGAHTLFFIKETAGKRRLTKVDLTRRNEASATILTETPISAADDVCRILETYSIKKDGTDVVLLVTRPGLDGACGNPDSTVESIKKLADDNITVAVGSNDSVDTPPTDLAQPNSKVIGRFYKEGTLTGILVQKKTGDNLAQLDVLSPRMHEVLQAGLSFSLKAPLAPAPAPAPFTVFSTPTSGLPNDGATWLTEAPGRVGAAYIRIQKKSAISSSPSFNNLYRINWDEAAKTATVSLQNINLTIGAINTAGFADDTHIFVTNEVTVFRGNTSTPGGSYRGLRTLAKSDKVPDGADPLYGLVPAYQTDKHLVYKQPNNAGTTSYYVVEKGTDSTTPLTAQGGLLAREINTSNDHLQILGLRGNNLIAQVKDDQYDVGGLSIAEILIPDNITAAIADKYTLGKGQTKVVNAHNIKVLSRVWGSKYKFGQRQLMNVVVCAKNDNSIGDCLNEDLRIMDFTNSAFGITLGKLSPTSAETLKVSEFGNLDTFNNLLLLESGIGGGAVTVRSPWLFNLGIKESLKEIAPYSAPPPATPSSAASQ